MEKISNEIESLGRRAEVHMSHQEWSAAHHCIELARKSYDARCTNGSHKKVSQKNLLKMSTIEAGVSIRTANQLERHGVTTMGDVMKTRMSEMKSWNNVGPRTINEILRVAEKVGLIDKCRGCGKHYPAGGDCGCGY